MTPASQAIFPLHRASVGELAEGLGRYYPAVHRLAHALSGRADVGRGIVRFVMGRAVRLAPSWDDEEQAEQWFYHYTILTSRRAIKHRPKPGDDVLLGERGPDDPAYVAFLAALRQLPHQQAEAFVLHFGEQLGERTTALAMDCSTEAASSHLTSATQALRLAAGDRFDVFRSRLNTAYRLQSPSQELVLPTVRRTVRRRVWTRRLGRLVGWLILLAVWATLGYVAWRAYHEVEI